VLLLAATPFLGVRFAQPDARSLPADSASRQLADAVQERFEGPLTSNPSRSCWTAWSGGRARGVRRRCGALERAARVTVATASLG
jgi:hypothetical protein